MDLAVSNGLFHELPSPDSVVREMFRVLKPGGWLVVTDFGDTRIGRRLGEAHRDGTHGPFSIRELEILLTRTGLKDVKVTPVRHWVLGAGKK